MPASEDADARRAPPARHGAPSSTGPGGAPVAAVPPTGIPEDFSDSGPKQAELGTAKPTAAHERLPPPGLNLSGDHLRVRPSTTTGIVFGVGSTMDWTPTCAARSSLAVDVGFRGAPFDASLSQLVAPPAGLPFAQTSSASQSTTSAIDVATPPSTRLLVVPGTGLGTTLPRTAPSANSGWDAPAYTPPTVRGLPGPTAANLTLAERPNVGVKSLPSAPSGLTGPVRRNPRRPRRQAVPLRPVLGVQDGISSHLQDVAKLIIEEWDAVSPATIAHCWAKACIFYAWRRAQSLSTGSTAPRIVPSLMILEI